MNSNRTFRFVIAAVILLGSGIWLLLQRPELTPETVQRQEAVQRALAPGARSLSGQPASGIKSAVDQDLTGLIITGERVEPVSVDIMNLPDPPAEIFSMKEAWEAGLFDREGPEGPYSELELEALRAESAAQPVDPSVQIVGIPPENRPDSASALTPLAGFQALSYADSGGFTPPDPIIAVGPNHIVAVTNTSIAIYDKSGNIAAGPVPYAALWGANCAEGANAIFFDPIVEYDEQEQRYIIGIAANATFPPSNNGYVCLAVSQTSSAVGNYWLYNFDGNPGPGPDLFFDYPHLGVGQKAIYVSGNMFDLTKPPQDQFRRNNVLAFDKFAMYAGDSAEVSLATASSQHFTLQPAKIHGYTTGGWPANSNEPHYYVSAGVGNGQNTLTVWQYSDPFGAGSDFGQAGTVTVDDYNMPLNQKQLGGGPVQANDNRLLDVDYWGGRLYATHAIGCNIGRGTNNCVRWYIIDISSGSPVLLDQGTIGSAGAGIGSFFPAIAANACGDLLLGYTMGGPERYYATYVMGREYADPAGTLKGERLQQAGLGAYSSDFDSVPYRWGDYSGMAIDPDGLRFWYLGEHAGDDEGTNWATSIGAYRWSACTGQPPEEHYLLFLPEIMKNP